MSDLSWMDLARCSSMDTALFFTDTPSAVSAAKAVCARCPVRPECLQAALDHPGTFGVWGGRTKYQRTRIRQIPVQRAKRTKAPGGMAAINARKTHCKYGHEFTEENTALYKGKRSCRECYWNRLRAKRASRRRVS